MPSLTKKLTDIVSEAFAASGYDPAYGEVVVSSRPDLGHFQCNGALPAASAYKKNPRQIAQQVVDRLVDQPMFATISLAGPGFINLSVADDYLVDHLQRMAADPRLSVDRVSQPRKVVVDYGGANVAKPLHVGHLRAGIIGESIKRLFRFMGDDVVGDVHLGDWGTQMGQIIIEIQRRQPDLPYFDENYTGPYPTQSPVTVADLDEIYPAASKRAKSDPAVTAAARQATLELQDGRPGYRALWQHIYDVSVADLKADYDKLEIHFDLWLGESHTQDRIDPLIERLQLQGHAYESNGAIVVDIARPDDKEPRPPLMLRKSDGAVLYGTTDLATIEQRIEELSAELILYVVDGRQQHHFEQVFRAAYKTNIVPETLGLEHNYFGTMNGKDGRPFKTRAGGVMKLKDLIAVVIEKALERMEENRVARDYEEAERLEIARQVGIAALKFADLVNQRTKDYVFDLERFSSFEGRTGPYLLYTAVRAKSILRKAADVGLAAGSLLSPAVGAERDLMLQLTELPDVLAMAYRTRMPNHMCEYVYRVANEFNRFYNTCHILSESNPEQQAAWLGLTQLTLRVVELVLDLLAIKVPERM